MKEWRKCNLHCIGSKLKNLGLRVSLKVLGHASRPGSKEAFLKIRGPQYFGLAGRAESRLGKPAMFATF